MSEKLTLTLDEKVLKAKKDFKPVLKNTVNPFLKNKYADLSTVADAIEDALSNNGLDYYQSIEGDGIMTVIPGAKPGEDTVLVSGQFVVTVITDGISQRKTTYPFIVRLDKNKPEQSLGAAHTYDRRHGLLAAFGLKAEDNDGEGNKKATPNQYGNKPATQQTTKPAAAPASKPAVQQTAKPAPAPVKTLDEIRLIEGVTVVETEDSITVGGKTYGLSESLRPLGFTWITAEKVWRKAKAA